MSDMIVKEGDWVLFRDGSQYRPIEVFIKQAVKVTPKLVRFDSVCWPRQISILGVVGAFADEPTALLAMQRINGGVSGEYERRRSSAEAERSRRITEALGSAQAKVAAIIAEYAA